MTLELSRSLSPFSLTERVKLIVDFRSSEEFEEAEALSDEDDKTAPRRCVCRTDKDGLTTEFSMSKTGVN